MKKNGNSGTVEAFLATQYPISHNPELGEKMSRNQLGLLGRQLEKKIRLSKKKDEEVCAFVLEWILYLDSLKTPVAQRAACKWFCSGTVILPEDELKILQAVKVAKINHVDPLAYDSPIGPFTEVNRSILLRFLPCNSIAFLKTGFRYSTSRNPRSPASICDTSSTPIGG